MAATVSESDTLSDEDIFKKFAFEQEQQQQQQELFKCAICWDEYPFQDVHFVESCGHTFCNDCMSGYCKNKVNEGATAIKCMDPKCKGEIGYYEFKHFLKEKALVDKYERFLLEKSLLQFKDLVWCPKPGCDTATPTYEDTEWVKCGKCLLTFCKKCKFDYGAHAEFTCEEMKKVGSINSFEDWMKLKGDKIKLCVKCSAICEKISGCDKMTCPKCKFFFCWVCLAPYTDSHPCKKPVVVAVVEAAAPVAVEEVD